LSYRDDLALKAERENWPNRFGVKDVYRLFKELKRTDDGLAFGFVDINILMSPQFPRLQEGLTRLNTVFSGIDDSVHPAEIPGKYIQYAVDFMNALRDYWTSSFDTQHHAYRMHYGCDYLPRVYTEGSALKYSGRFDLPEDTISRGIETINACMVALRGAD
jgi:hypothetical protein